jgi:hypothetical protein
MLAALGRAIFFSFVGPVGLSLIWAAYFGYKQSRYLFVVVGALICTGYFLWTARSSFRHAFSDHSARPRWHLPTQVLAIVGMTFAAFLVADSLIYFAASYAIR